MQGHRVYHKLKETAPLYTNLLNQYVVYFFRLNFLIECILRHTILLIIQRAKVTPLGLCIRQNIGINVFGNLSGACSNDLMLKHQNESSYQNPLAK